jgi:hypothetical protein
MTSPFTKDRPLPATPSGGVPLRLLAVGVTVAHLLGVAQAGGVTFVSPRPANSEPSSLRINPFEDKRGDLVLPNIGGWVMLPDGVTLIVALPEEAKLAYIDTVANKELKRTAQSFKPDRLAVQGRHLCASVQGASTIHILDLDSGADRKVVKVQGTVVDMVSHPEKGVVLVATFNPGTALIDRIFAVDAVSGAVVLAGDLASARLQARIAGQPVGPPAIYSVSVLSVARGGRLLALDPTNLGTLYAAHDNGSGRRPEDRRHWLSLVKYAVGGRIEVNRVPPTWAIPGYVAPMRVEPGSTRFLPLGPFWPLERIAEVTVASPPTVDAPPGALHVSRDGKRVAVLGGGDQITIFTTEDISSRAGTVNCPRPADFAYHPVLEMMAVEGRNLVSGQDAGTALYLFHSDSLAQITRITFSSGPFANPPRAGRLLTFAARGTKLLYYDWLRGGTLRSLPLSLPGPDRQALAKAYGAPILPFRVPGAIEGESMKILASSPDFSFTPQDMTPFLVGRWSGDSQLFARGIKAQAWAELELPAPADGKYHVVAYLTGSWDYGIIQIHVNGVALGKPIDGFHADRVVGAEAVDLGEADLKKCANTLRVEVIGSNPSSQPPHFSWGLDCVALQPLL